MAEQLFARHVRLYENFFQSDTKIEERHNHNSDYYSARQRSNRLPTFRCPFLQRMDTKARILNGRPTGGGEGHLPVLALHAFLLPAPVCNGRWVGRR